MASGYNVYQNVLNKLKNPYDNTYTNPYVTKPLSPVQQQIGQYAQQIKTENKIKTKPLQWIFDRLQTGQYVTANMVDQAIKNTKQDDPLLSEIGSVLKAGWQGITGQRKGNYKDILTQDLGMKDRKGKIDLSDILGFVGDVFLDPTTYISFGASKMGVSAASKYADDVARFSLKKLGKELGTGKADDLIRYATKNFDINHFHKLMKTSEEKASQYFARNAGGDVAREIGKIRKLAYKKALKTPAAQLREELLAKVQPMAAEEQAKIAGKSLNQLAKNGITDTTRTAILEKSSQPTFLSNLANSIPTAYGGAGSRVDMRFMGHEFGTKVRPLNSLEKAKEIIIGGLNKLPGTSLLKDVWWKINSTGPIGAIRKAIGIRDPYGKLINLEYMEKGQHYHLAKLREYSTLAAQATTGFDEQVKNKWVLLTDMAEEMWQKDKTTTAFSLLSDPDILKRLNIDDVERQSLEKLGSNVDGLIRKYRADYMKIAQEGIVNDMNDIVNYLPVSFKEPNLKTAKYFTEMGTSRPGYSMTREFTRQATVQQEAAKLTHVLGISNGEAIKLIRDHNMSGLNMNLDELLSLRGYAQAQVEKRANMIRTFREFGIPSEEAQGFLADALNRTGGNYASLGLAKSEEMGLEGMLFDREVAGVINRVSRATDPRHITWWQKKFIDFNSWWKGMATMTTGFHARNNISNQVTGFMVHGIDWFDIPKTLDANAMAVYAMKKADVTKSLKEIGMSEGMYNRLLNKRYGNYSLKELADMQINSGLLSEAQMGIDAKTAFDKYMKKSSFNPFSLDFKGRDLSQKLGGWIENSAKAKSFLIDYDQILKQGANIGEDVSDQALKYAERNAKKWWIDYSDLTEFEQRTMKNIIPFYTWMRKNIGNQLEGLLIYPQTFSIFPKIKQAFEYDDPGFDPKSIPSWMEDLGMFPTGKGNYLFRPDMPFMDINKIPLVFEGGSYLPKFDASNFKDDIVNSAHPIIKTIASLMTKKGYDFFRKKDLEADAPAPLFLRFLTKNVKTLQNIDGLFSLAGITGFKPRVDENGKLRINARWLNFLNNNLPIIRNLNLIVEAGTLPPGIMDAVENATGYKPDYEKADQLFRVLGSLFGIKFYPFNEQKAKEDYARGIYYKATKRRTDAMRSTPASVQRRAEAKRKTNDIISRIGI